MTMAALVNTHRRVIVWVVPLLSSHVLLFLQLVSANREITSHPESLPSKWRYDSKSDAFPAPRGSEQDVFASRILHWHVMYCGKSRVCKDHVANNCFRCSPCQCDLNCTFFGDCCPDIVLETGGDDFQRPFTGSDNNVLSCESTELPDSSFGYSHNSYNYKKDKLSERQTDVQIMPGHGQTLNLPRYFMTSRCPQGFTGDVNECENSEIISPVAGATKDFMQVFKNINCAHCHDVFDVIPWDIQISCEKRTSMTSFYTPGDAVLKSLSQPNCTIAYIPPWPQVARRCHSDVTMTSRCNITGKWTKRDSFLERACHSYLTPKVVGEVMYKNVFCFMCNHGDEPQTQMLLTSCQKLPVAWSPAMEVTLRYLDLTRAEASDDLLGDIPYKLCNTRGIYDYIEESCREVTCEVGQHLVAGMCQPLFLSVHGLGYELYFGLRPMESVDVSGDQDVIHRLPAEMEVFLGQTLLQGKFMLQDFAMSFNTTDQAGRCSQTSSDLALYARLVSQTPIDQAQLQNELLQVRHAMFNIAAHTWNMSFQSFPSETAWHTLHLSRRQAPQTLSTCVIIVSNSHMQQRRDGTMRVGTTTPDPTIPIENENPSYIRLTSLLNCSHVQLLPHEYSVTWPGGDLILAWGVVLPGSRYYTDLEGNVTICLSDFVLKLEQSRSKRSSIEETLAMVFLTISMLCLCACFVVFLLFAVLRSLPDKNNMVLIACLFASQFSMLIDYLIDDTSRMCSVMGATLHYFTLCAFCSLIVCSYHVYATFTTMHLSRDPARDVKFIIFYFCFTFLVPLVIVGSVITFHISHQVTWRSFGYGGGGSFCFLSSTLSLWLTVFLPIVASMLVVFVLFCLAANSLQHSKDVETNTTDERHVNFYFRASLIITLAWVIGVIGRVTSVVPLNITFIICQCLLGIYIFVSLILTPRVTKLLSGSCCQSRRPPRGRTSLNIKMASSNDCPVKPPCILGTGYRKRDPNLTGSDDSKRHPLERYTKRSEFMESVA